MEYIINRLRLRLIGYSEMLTLRDYVSNTFFDNLLKQHNYNTLDSFYSDITENYKSQIILDIICQLNLKVIKITYEKTLNC